MDDEFKFMCVECTNKYVSYGLEGEKTREDFGKEDKMKELTLLSDELKPSRKLQADPPS